MTLLPADGLDEVETAEARHFEVDDEQIERLRA